MFPRIKFHLDENVNSTIANALHKMGIDVSTTPEKQLRSSTDNDQWSFAKAENRVFVTHDTDFLVRASKDVDHPGIIFCNMRGHSIGSMIFELVEIHNTMLPEEIKGRIEFI